MNLIVFIAGAAAGAFVMLALIALCQAAKDGDTMGGPENG